MHKKVILTWYIIWIFTLAQNIKMNVLFHVCIHIKIMDYVGKIILDFDRFARP